MEILILPESLTFHRLQDMKQKPKPLFLAQILAFGHVKRYPIALFPIDYASKAAFNHLTRVMASSLAKKFITVNAIAPGVFPSKMTRFGIENAGDILEMVQPMGIYIIVDV
jgi:NAD(P)-dependent dehydrogenase (short-subunit alcohol dehydrogenase family)